jgi:hypothetical protein
MSVGEISMICQEPGKVFNEMKLNLFRVLVLIYFFQSAISGAYSNSARSDL